MRQVLKARLAADLPKLFAEEMGQLLGPDFPKHIALGVSGGGDSMAMLYLAVPWARVMGITLWPVTVDHGLRPESAAEAQLVAEACEELGLNHTTLFWHWDSTGNVQAQAREARLRLIDRWRRGIEHVAFAHTQDDVAETFLMRLARGSGVEGLSAMAGLREVMPHLGGKTGLKSSDVKALKAPPIPTRRVAGVPAYSKEFAVVRPLLKATRSDLRHFLRVLRVDYVDDPTNDDPSYDRVRMRQALPVLGELGITAEKLAATATRLSDVREALALRARAAHQGCLLNEEGSMLFDVAYSRDAFAELERDTQLRLLAAALQYVSLNPYRPRRAPLEEALDRALGGGSSTLHGGYVHPHKEALFICAEFARVQNERAEGGTWRGLFATDTKDVRPLGEKGAAQVRNQSDLPARVLWPCPAVWDGETVIATPRLGSNPHWNPQPDLRRFGRLLASR
ncbi:MAG: tRNA lysidine(34) synthetase TilS [Pseudomonadota bacterium]